MQTASLCRLVLITYLALTGAGRVPATRPGRPHRRPILRVPAPRSARRECKGYACGFEADSFGLIIPGQGAWRVPAHGAGRFASVAVIVQPFTMLKRHESSWIAAAESCFTCTAVSWYCFVLCCEMQAINPTACIADTRRAVDIACQLSSVPARVACTDGSAAEL